MKTTLFRGLLLATAAALLPISAMAQKKPSDISVEDFFKREQYSQMTLSPDGKKLAALTPLKGRNNLAIVDLDKRASNVITAFEKADAAGIFWVNNQRLCLRVTDGQEVSGEAPRFNGLYCINADGSDLRNHSEVSIGGARRTPGPVAFIAGDSDEFIMAMRGRSQRSQDLYRFNTVTARYTLLTDDNPGYVTQWVLDRNLVPRIAVSTPEREIGEKGKGILLTTTVYYRASADAKWEALWSFKRDDPNSDSFDPVAFDFDNETLYVATNKGRDKEAIYAYDTKTRQMGGLLLEHPLIDVDGGLIFSWTKKKLVGVSVNADKPVVVWTDPDRARLQRSIDATLPKTFNTLAFARDNDQRVLIHSYSDSDPGTYHLYDAGTKKLETIAKQREWLDPNLMAERKFIVYKARDGMEIPAYVTIPKGGGKNLPLVVNIHGGPWVRAYTWSEWGRWPEAQFFASRGYVVLEPEPRGSLGWGRKHYFSSFKQWGQAMQDDITDGALQLVKEGLVDKDRMCLHGGSYGGYATLMGLVKEPDLWKCGSALVAVSDLGLFQTVTESDLSTFTDLFQEEFVYRVGDSSKDKAMFDKYSPARNADKIKAKLLLTMGGNDVRVPIAHGIAMHDAMVKAGKPIEYVVYPGEGHGYNKDENVNDQYRRSLKLFDETIGNGRK
jgi:dipeptidyl aminopeptidase/acylaminoacyl peptidase